MNPDTTLDLIHQCISHWYETVYDENDEWIGDQSDSIAEALISYFTDLDVHLRNGGTLPTDWNNK